MKRILARLAALFRRAPPAPGRFSVNRKSSLHGFLSVAPAPPWREYLLYLPHNMAALREPALVVWLHGCNQDPEKFAASTRVTRFADERGFAVLLPRQTRLANTHACWNWFDRRTVAGAGEAAIVAAQVMDVRAKLGIDPRRVYLAGLSSGGTLAATLALRMPALFAAAAFHSAVACGAATSAHDATQVMTQGPADEVTDRFAAAARETTGAKARVPALVIHGSADATVDPVNAVYLARQFLLFNGFPPGELPPGAALPPSPTRDGPRGCIVSEFHHERRLAAQLVTIPELGHAWSGGDPAYPYGDDRFLDATALICDFFAAHAAR